MSIANRRKVCELQIEKQAYLRHISRLEQLKYGRSPQQLRRNRQQKKLVQTINTVRRMHNNNRQFRQREMKQVQQESRETDFNKIKSVIVQDFNWPIPTVAPKHRRNQQPIVQENMKMFQRIVQTKCNVVSQNLDYTDRKSKTRNPDKQKTKAPLPCISSDFSKLYETSLINEAPQRVLKLKLGKSKKSHKVRLQINFQQLYETVKDRDSMYLLEGWFGDLRARSEGFVLGELECMRVVVRVGEKEAGAGGRLKINLVKILDCHEKKEVCKARLYADISKQTLAGPNKQNHQTPSPGFYSTNQSPRSTNKSKLSKPKLLSSNKRRKNSQTLEIALQLQKQSRMCQLGSKTLRTYENQNQNQNAGQLLVQLQDKNRKCKIL